MDVLSSGTSAVGPEVEDEGVLHRTPLHGTHDSGVFDPGAFGFNPGAFSRVAAAASLGLCVLGGMTAPADARRHHSEASKANDKPEPPKQPSGPILLAISINGQRVTVYDNGTPIASSQISTGMSGHPTPMGIFSVIQKQRWHQSNIYSGAPMPYMQRITWSGIALHAGVVPGHPASHGCIRLPAGFAVRLYGLTRLGARVIITRGNVAPYVIDHPRLAGLVKPPEPVPAPPPVANPDGAKSDGGALSQGAVVVATTGPVSTGGSTTEDAPVGSGHAEADSGSAVPAAPATNEPEQTPPPPPGEDVLKRPGQLSLFISRREGKLFVRKGFTPAFDVPITIAQRDQPLGTHVFTASRTNDGGIRWLGVSLGYDRQPAGGSTGKGKHREGHAERERPAAMTAEALRKSAADALDRIELPSEALARVIPLVTSGTSVVISDQGLGGETGKETDFIVVTK